MGEPLTPAPMLARLVRELPDDGYVFEPKWDGFRCLASRHGPEVEMTSRHGRPLARYFPELVGAFAGVVHDPWLIDGEVLVVMDGRLDFPSLMARLHPAATRVRELAERMPALFVAFDALHAGGEDLRAAPFAERRGRLVALLEQAGPPLFVTPATEDRAVAEEWLTRFRGGGLDGVVAKRRDLTYQPGVRAMLKVKHEQTADCVVAGVRGTGTRPAGVASLMLGLYDEAGALEHVGVVSSLSRADRAAFAHALAPLVTGLEGHPWEHGFLSQGGPTGRLKGAAGRWVPGMTMDWTPVRPERVCEVAYTQVDAHRFRHPAKFRRWRPDRDPRSCRIEQLDVPAPAAGDVLAGG